jgi:hypothetical protein
MRPIPPLYLLVLALLIAPPICRADEPPPWLKAHAWKLPSEYTNQESGYFFIVAGHNDRSRRR